MNRRSRLGAANRSRARLLGLAGFAVLCLAGGVAPLTAARATSCVDYGGFFDVIGTSERLTKGGWSGVNSGLAVVGDIAYVIDGAEGLVLVDVSDPTSPLELGGVDVSASPRDVEVSLPHAFVCSDDSLFVVDVSEPGDPQVAAIVPSTGGWQLALVGEVLFVARDVGLVAFDVSDPIAPVEIASVATGEEARGLEVHGDLAYVAAFGAGLEIWDVGDPTSMSLVGDVETHQARDVSVLGTIAAVADGIEGLKLVDVADPAAPVVVGAAAVFELGQQDTRSRFVTLFDTYVCVSNEDTDLRIFDVSNPANPKPVGWRFFTFAEGESVVIDDQLFVAGFSHLHVLDVTNPRSVPALDHLPANNAFLLGASESLIAYANAGETRIVDAADPSQLEPLATVDQTGAVLFEGDLLHIGSTALTLYDVSQPTSPTQLGSVVYDPSGINGAEDLVRRGDLVYIAAFLNGLVIVDAGDPAAPELLSVLPIPGPKTQAATGVTVRDGIAYVTTIDYGDLQGGTLTVVDVTIPEVPVLMSQVETSDFATSVDLVDHYAYVSTWDGFRVYDVSGILPAEIATSLNDEPGFSYGYGEDVVVLGDVAYVADGWLGVAAVDVTDPADPREIGRTMRDTSGDQRAAFRLAVTLKAVYVGYGFHGVYAFPRQCDTTVSVPPHAPVPAVERLRVAALPNPFAASTVLAIALPTASHARVHIFDAAGTLVRTLVDGPLDGGRHRVEWDGLDERGHATSAGVYFCHVETDIERLSHSVVRIR